VERVKYGDCVFFGMVVAVVKCKDYGSVGKMLPKALSLIGGMGRYVKKDQRVLVKPNLLLGKLPEDAATTHPEILRAVLFELKKIGASVIVGDSPGMGNFDGIARKTGLKVVCDEFKVEIVELKERVDVERKQNKLVKLFTISKLANDVDVIINLPKMKTHTLTHFTGAVKNIFGCIPGKLKPQFHLRQQDAHTFSRMLVDLNKVVVPSLHIMDAVVGMEGQGPSSGNPREVGLLIVGKNPYEVDSVACSVAGVNNVPYVEIARKQKLLGRVVIRGEKLDSVKLSRKFLPARSSFDRIPKWLLKMFKGLFTAKPWLVPEKCIHCARCFEVCPADAIKMVDGYPRFDYNKCIRCYCCHEMCPAKAIGLKDSFLLKIFKK
jgi:uncharacterized protein (DUF362 family)/Pyruvate/2-oxoacid:ferredoxin oxidoreductase delta subunit